MHSELKDHLGNVRLTVGDRRFAGDAKVLTAASYYPFGMAHGQNSLTPGGYRFGYQSQEKDDEISGSTGTHYAFEYRMHDTRIGRFWSIDPLTASYPHNSPYAFSENRVIDGVELEGLEYKSVTNQDGTIDLKWDQENAYDNTGKLKSNYFDGGVIMNDKGNWKASWSDKDQAWKVKPYVDITVCSTDEWNCESRKTYKSTGSTMPSDPFTGKIIMPGLYLAKARMHRDMYPALQLNTLSGSSFIPTVDGGTAVGVNFHYAKYGMGSGWSQLLGNGSRFSLEYATSVGTATSIFKFRQGESANYYKWSTACQLADYKVWKPIISNFYQNPNDFSTYKGGKNAFIVNRPDYSKNMPAYHPEPSRPPGADLYDKLIDLDKIWKK